MTKLGFTQTPLEHLNKLLVLGLGVCFPCNLDAYSGLGYFLPYKTRGYDAS